MQDRARGHTQLDRIVLPLLNGVSPVAAEANPVPHDLSGRADPRRTRAGGADASPESRLATQLIARRRQRDELLGAHINGEHFWGILLDLFIAAEEGQDLTISELCSDDGAPPDATLRWLSALIAHGMIVQRRDLQDPGRFRLRLASEMADRIRRLLRLWLDESV